MCVNTHRVKVCELCEEEREPHAESSLSAGLQQVFLGNDAVLWSLFSVQVGGGGGGLENRCSKTQLNGKVTQLVCVRLGRSHCSHVGESRKRPYSNLTGAICFKIVWMSLYMTELIWQFNYHYMTSRCIWQDTKNDPFSSLREHISRPHSFSLKRTHLI